MVFCLFQYVFNLDSTYHFYQIYCSTMILCLCQSNYIHIDENTIHLLYKVRQTVYRKVVFCRVGNREPTHPPQIDDMITIDCQQINILLNVNKLAFLFFKGEFAFNFFTLQCSWSLRLWRELIQIQRIEYKVETAKNFRNIS